MKTTLRSVLSAAAVLLLLASTLSAQERVTRTPGHEVGESRARASAVGASSSLVVQREDDTIVQWDGTAENGYTYQAGPGIVAEFIQLLTMTADSGVIELVSAGFLFEEPVTDFTYEVVVYANDGGVPGALIDSVELVLAGTNDGAFFIEGEVLIPVDQGRVFVGVRWEPVAGTTVDIDENGAATSPAFTRAAQADPWVELPEPGTIFGSFRNLGIEVEFVPGDDPQPETCPATACVAGTETLCLENDRFEVTADFVDQAGGSGAVEFAEELTPNTGYGHYGHPDNVELVVKVLNACGPSLNNRFWVFAAGLTDQEITLRVCDTETGMQNTYFSPLKTAFQPITDTDAFATCP